MENKLDNKATFDQINEEIFKRSKIITNSGLGIDYIILGYAMLFCKTLN